MATVSTKAQKIAVDHVVDYYRPAYYRNGHSSYNIFYFFGIKLEVGIIRIIK